MQKNRVTMFLSQRGSEKTWCSAGMKPTLRPPLLPRGTPPKRTSTNTVKTMTLTVRHGLTSMSKLSLPIVLNRVLPSRVCVVALSGSTPVRTKPTVMNTFSSEFTGPNDRVRPRWCAVALLAFTDRTQGPDDALRNDRLYASTKQVIRNGQHLFATPVGQNSSVLSVQSLSLISMFVPQSQWCTNTVVGNVTVKQLLQNVIRISVLLAVDTWKTPENVPITGPATLPVKFYRVKYDATRTNGMMQSMLLPDRTDRPTRPVHTLTPCTLVIDLILFPVSVR